MLARQHVVLITALALVGAIAAAVVVNRSVHAPERALIAASAKLQQQSSATIRTTMKIETARGTVTGYGDGQVDLANSRSSIRMHLTGGGQVMTMDEIDAGRTAYVRAITDGTPSEWISMDLGAVLGSDPTQASGDPTAPLKGIGGAMGKVETVGPELVNGSKVTHYRTTIDLAKVFGSGGASSSRGAKTPIELWIDDQGLPRKQVTTLTLDTAGQSMTMVNTVEYLQFGVPTSIVLPDPATVRKVDPTAAPRR